MTPQELMRDGRYLPVFMRDFHDQKELFKRIDEIVMNRKKNDSGKPEHIYSEFLPTWTVAHIYVVDFFLWYMARCGYTLQRTRHAKGDFVDLVADVFQHRQRRIKDILEALPEAGTGAPEDTTP